MRHFILLFLIFSAAARAADGDIVSVAIEPNGWVAQVVIASAGAANTNGTFTSGMTVTPGAPGGNHYALSGAETFKLTVDSMGFDETCTPVVRSRILYGGSLLRYPYPYHYWHNTTNREGNLTIWVALSDYVYQRDSNLVATLAGGLYATNALTTAAATIPVSNNSTSAYVNVIAHWRDVPWQLNPGGTRKLKALAFHESARQGLPVAAVKFWAQGIGGHSNAPVIAAAPGIDPAAGDPVPVIEYIATLDNTVFDQGEMITNHFAAYPWIGDQGAVVDTTSVADTDSQYANPFLSYCNKDGTWMKSYCVVDPANGTAAGGVVVWDQADLGRCAPFDSIRNALVGLASANQAHWGTNSWNNSTLYLTNGANVWPGATALPATAENATWVTITRHPNTARADAQISAMNAVNLVKNARYKFCDLSVTHTANTPQFWGGGRAFWFDQVGFTRNPGANSVLAALGTNIWMTRCQVGQRGAGWVQSPPGKQRYKMWGNTFTNVMQRCTPSVFVGNLVQPETNSLSALVNDFPATPISPFIWAFNKIYSLSGSVVFSVGVNASVPNGGAVIQNLAETTDNMVTAHFQVTADKEGENCRNVLAWHNTLAGARYHAPRNAASTHQNYVMMFQEKNNLTSNKAIAFDTWDTNPSPSEARTNRWAVMYSVSISGNIALNVGNDSSGWPESGGALGNLGWNGLQNHYYAENRPGRTMRWLRDLSWNYAMGPTKTAGNGDYHLTEFSPGIGAAQDWILPYDIEGVPRYAGGAAGAYEWSRSTSIIALSGDLAFGNVPVGTSAVRTLRITNLGASTLTVNSLTCPDGFNAHWTGTIAAAGSQDVTVTFSPTWATSFGGDLAVNSDAGSGTRTIAVSGTGTPAPTRIIALSGNLAFGSVLVGGSAERTLRISNLGASTLTVNSLSCPDGFSAHWAGTIAAAGSQDVTVTFSPLWAASYGGDLTVSSDATSGAGNLELSGAGVSSPVLRVLTVSSTNPDSNVAMTVSPNDGNGQGDGPTPFTRIYSDQTVVTLTAPASDGANLFQKWQRNGVDWCTTLTASVALDADYSVSAIYRAPYTASDGDIVSVSIEPIGWVAKVVMASAGAANTNGIFTSGMGLYNRITGAERFKLNVTSCGYDDTGATNTVSRTVYGGKLMRYPYPDQVFSNTTNEGSRLTIWVVLDEFVYAKDVVTADLASGLYATNAFSSAAASGVSVRNDSAFPYPKVIASWLDVPYQLVGANYARRMTAFHAHPQQGRQVRVVKFWDQGSLGHSNQVAYVTTPVIDWTYGDPVPVIEYTHPLEISPYAQGERITNYFAAYPWIGDASSVADCSPVTDVDAPMVRPFIVQGNKTGDYMQAHAVVDSVNGNNNTGTVVHDLAQLGTCNPYLTIAGALNGIAAKNRIQYGDNSWNNSFVYLTNSATWCGGTVTSVAENEAWVTITRHPQVDRAAAAIKAVLNNQKIQRNSKIKCFDLTLGVAANVGLFTAGHRGVWIDRCTTLDNPGNACVLIGSSTNAYLTRNTLGLRGYGYPHGYFAPTWKDKWFMRGNTFTDKLVRCSPWVFVGNLVLPATPKLHNLSNNAGGGSISPAIWAFNKILRCDGSLVFAIGLGGNVNDGFVVAQNLVERVTSAVQPHFDVMRSTQDGETCTNFLVYHNTLAGAAYHPPYNHTENSQEYISNYADKNNLFSERDFAFDNYPNPYKSTARTNRWSLMYSVGCSGNVSAMIGNQEHYPETSTAYGNLAWNGIMNLWSTLQNPNALHRWAGDASWNGGSAVTTGNGDYHLTASSPAIGLAREWILAYDLEGTPRYAGGASGAYEWPQPVAVLAQSADLEPEEMRLKKSAWRAGTPDNEGSPAPTISHLTRLDDGGLRVQFQSDLGRVYRVQYSADARHWKTAATPLRGNGGVVEWKDTGIPETERHPTSVAVRFYRIIVAPK